MQLKSTYERNKYRIQKGLGRVSIYTNFGDYLASAVNKNMNLLLTRIMNNENIDSACKNYLYDCFDIALKEMLVNSTRGAKSGKDNPNFDQTKGDYKAIYDALTNTVTGANHRNYLINELTRVLQLDRLTDYLKQIILGDELTPTTAAEFKKHFNVTPSSGGLAAENFEGVVQRMIQEGVLPIGELNNLRASFNAGLLKGEVFVTGDYGSKEKADLVWTVGASGIFRPFVNNGDEKSLRANAVRYYEELGQRLSTMSEGFIIYENLKSYSSYKGGKIGNFHTGADIPLYAYASVAAAAGMSGDFITALMNLIPGALGEGNREAAIEAIASTVAYLLFDDVATIGKSYQQVGVSGRAVHVFNLSGIYVPLSVFLYKFGSQLSTLGTPSSFVNAHVSTPSGVMYPFSENLSPMYGAGRDTTKYWQEQAAVALKEITVGARFWSGFGDFVSNL